MKNIKIGTKIALGFGILILIAMALGGMAVVNMNTVAVESTKLDKEYIPEVNIATQIRSGSTQLMLGMGML